MSSHDKIVYKITIIDTNGNDASSNLNVQPQSLFGSSRPKRDVVARPLNECPSFGFFDYTFVESKCGPDTDLRNYILRCRLSDSITHNLRDQCAPDELCVEGFSSHPNAVGGSNEMAYCVSRSAFTPLGQNGHVEEQGAIGTSSGGSIGQASSALELVLTNTASTSPLRASQLQIAAQSVKQIFNAKSYSTLDGGFSSCENCATLRLQPVPSRTQEFDIKIVLWPGTTGTLLFGLLSL